MSFYNSDLHHFDGVLGLSLGASYLPDNRVLMQYLESSPDVPLKTNKFGLFFSNGGLDTKSQITFGSANSELVDSVSWFPVLKSDVGFWQV